MSYSNRPAPGISYYTPAQEPPAGTFLSAKGNGVAPKLFTPLSIRGLTMQNRILLSPLDQYSADQGHQTAWHLAHLGGIAKRGPGLTMIEALAVVPEGRVTPQDAGIWDDSHIASLKTFVEFAHSQGQRTGLQLAHAGRKASTLAPWLIRHGWAGKDVGGWPDKLVGPSNIGYDFDGAGPRPRAMTLDDIDNVVNAFRAAAIRSLSAGVDYIEVHAAHGYLIHQFLSPVTNVRTDHYGGSFENRTRLAIRIVKTIREVMPHDMPLFVRISATDWLEENNVGIKDSWTPDQSARLAVLLQDAGVDVLDVSSAGLHQKQKIKPGRAYQVPFARLIKKALGPDPKMLICAVGGIDSAKLAESLLQGEGGEPPLDIIAVGRGFQKNPGLVYTWAEELGVQVKLPYQIGWHQGREVRDNILKNTSKI